jgi:hypothetical protein
MVQTEAPAWGDVAWDYMRPNDFERKLLEKKRLNWLAQNA